MASSRIIVFDLYETLIHEPDYSWDRVYNYLITNVFSKNVSLAELKEYCWDVWAPKYKQRGTNEIDIEDEIRDLVNMYGIKDDLTLSEITQKCLYEVGRCHLFDDTITVLEKLKELKFEIHLLSNCIYHKKQMVNLLDKLGITKYFQSIHFSSDYKVRKPSSKFFEVVINDVKKRIPHINIKDIIFSGDNFEADIYGSYNSGMTPIYINRKNDDNKILEEKFDVPNDGYYIVNNLTELLNLIQLKLEA